MKYGRVLIKLLVIITTYRTVMYIDTDTALCFCCRL